MEKKLLILFICFLIVTLVPASAVETSSIISQKTGNIKQDQVNISNEKNEISSNTHQLDQHVKIIKDTINGMQHVKWYQFWKWDFYIRQGPNRIQQESKIIETISNDVGNKATKVEKDVNSTIDTGNNSLQIGIEKANQITESEIADNKYNVGNASANVDIIASALSSRFKKNYIVTGKGTLQNGDIVQYPLTHDNYVYLQFVGMNPSGDTALFLGDTNTAVRLPATSLNNIQYKISSENSDVNSNTVKTKDPKSKNNKTYLPSENTFTSQQTSYIAIIQKKGLKNYTDTIVNNYNNQIDDKTDIRSTGSMLMIAGGVIGSVAVGMWIVLSILNYISFVIAAMAAVIWALLGVEAGVVTSIGIMGIIATSLGIVSAALLGTGGGIYATADSSLDDLNGNKNTFVNGCNALESDFKSYNNGVVNSLPVAQDISIDTEQNNKVTSRLNATDSDGDGLIYATVKEPSNGTLTLNGNGTCTYAPKKGFTGNDSFTYLTNDIYGNSNTATVHMVVHPVNHAPVSANMYFDIETNNNLTAQLNATDADADPITYMLVNSTSNGSITVNSDGTFNYTPTAGFIGNDTFTYSAKDWKGNGNIATEQINVHPVNHLPVGGDVNLTVAKNENITGTFQATDADGDNLFFEIINKPSKGAVTLNPDGTFIYKPIKNIVVNDRFTYKVYDWQGGSNLGTVNMEIYEFNHQPMANNVTVKTLTNRLFTGHFNVTDLDDDKLTYKIVTKPVHGTLVLRSGEYIYTPNTNFKGNDGFTYQANDGKNQSNIATIKISVLKSIPNTANTLVILNAPNKVDQTKNTLENQIKNTPYAPNTNKQKNQTINPQTSNTTDINSLTGNNPTNYLLILINTTTNTVNQIIQKISQIIKVYNPHN